MSYPQLKNDYMQRLDKLTVPQLRKVAKARAQAMQDIQESVRLLQQVWREVPKDVKFVQDHMADKGWFFPLGPTTASFIMKLRRELENNNLAELEQTISDYVREQSPNIRDSAITQFPERSDILNQAFDAHKQRHYGVSVPAMLSGPAKVSYGFWWDVYQAPATLCGR